MTLPTESFQLHLTLTSVGPARRNARREGRRVRALGPTFSAIFQLISKMVATPYDRAPKVWPILHLTSHIHCTEMFWAVWAR